MQIKTPDNSLRELFAWILRITAGQMRVQRNDLLKDLTK